MVKFSSEFREKVVLDYLTGSVGTDMLAKKYGIKDHSTILNWVHRYEKYGVEAFTVRSSDFHYDGNFKLEVLEWKKSNNASLTETCLHFNISTASTVWTWEKKFAKEGVGALFRERGRSKKMERKLKDTKQSKMKEPTDLEKVQRENRLLRIENEYLKKMRALIQEPKDTDKSKRK
jgi:transposase